MKYPHTLYTKWITSTNNPEDGFWLTSDRPMSGAKIYISKGFEMNTNIVEIKNKWAVVREGGRADVYEGGRADVREGGQAVVREGGRAVVREGGRADVHEGGRAIKYDQDVSFN